MFHTLQETKCSHEKKLSRLGKCPCLQRQSVTRVNYCSGTRKISCEQHLTVLLTSQDNFCPKRWEYSFWRLAGMPSRKNRNLNCLSDSWKCNQIYKSCSFYFSLNFQNSCSLEILASYLELL